MHQNVGCVAFAEIERPAINFDVDLNRSSPAPGEEGVDSEQDFDSVKIQSSTQDSESQVDVDQQVSDSRRLIDEIQDLVTYGEHRR